MKAQERSASAYSQPEHSAYLDTKEAHKARSDSRIHPSLFPIKSRVPYEKCGLSFSTVMPEHINSKAHWWHRYWVTEIGGQKRPSGEYIE